MEDKHANRISHSSPPSPSFLPLSSTVDVVALQLEHNSNRNAAGSDNALPNQSLTGPLLLPKAKALAQPGLTQAFDESNLHSSLSVHVLARIQTPPISTASSSSTPPSSRSKVSTDSNLSAAVDKEPVPLSSTKPSFSNTVSNLEASLNREKDSPPANQVQGHQSS